MLGLSKTLYSDRPFFSKQDESHKEPEQLKLRSGIMRRHVLDTHSPGASQDTGDRRLEEAFSGLGHAIEDLNKTLDKWGKEKNL